MNDIVVVSAVRTPMGKFGQSLKHFSAPQLGGLVIQEAVRRASLNPDAIDEVIIGNVISAGLGQNVARQASILAGLPFKTAALHVDKVCGSSLKAVVLAVQAIKAGDANVVVAGGMESMTNCPYLLDKARFGYHIFDGKVIDSMVKDGLWDAYHDFHMGMTGELVAEKYGITREDCDQFAVWSHQKAAKAAKDGLFSNEIVPVSASQKADNEIILDKDEGIRPDTSIEKLSKLPPVFKKDGIITAGNASQITDGAAAVVVMSKDTAVDNGLRPLASIKGYNTVGVKPDELMEAPIHGVRQLLARVNLSINDIGLIEHNEAFSSAGVAVINQLNINKKMYNVHGGAIALGHPIGASGARILVTLLHAMEHHQERRGLATICLGGGHAVTMVVER